MRIAFGWISTILFVVLGLFLVAFGMLYASVNDYLPFHAAALPEAAREAARPLYFALMKLIGGASAALGMLGLYVTLLPMRRGLAGAGLMVSLSYAGALVMAAFVAEALHATTGAPTSWHIMGVLLGMTAAAFALHCARPPAVRRADPA